MGASNLLVFTLVELLVLLFCGAVIFLPRLAELPFHGEEPRRTICAWELILSGNGFVPTIQGEPFLSRPPFQNWIIALTGTAIGNFGHLDTLPADFPVSFVFSPRRC